VNKPRWVQHLYAVLNSYFWLPCPICGQDFGGHESGNRSLITAFGEGKTVCCDCVQNGRLEDEQERIRLIPRCNTCVHLGILSSTLVQTGLCDVWNDFRFVDCSACSNYKRYLNGESFVEYMR
jgi:hypothetical protein